MRGHLPAARGWIVGGTDGPKQHLLGRDAQSEGKSAIAVVRIEPVAAGAQAHRRGYLSGLVSGPADLEKNSILPLEEDLTIIDAARFVHEPECANQVVAF